MLKVLHTVTTLARHQPSTQHEAALSEVPWAVEAARLRRLSLNGAAPSNSRPKGRTTL